MKSLIFAVAGMVLTLGAAAPLGADTAELYRQWQDALIAGHFNDAAARGRELDAALRLKPPEGRPLRDRFPLAFYGVPFEKVGRELAALSPMPPTPKTVTIRLVRVAPLSWRDQEAASALLARSDRLFVLLMQHLSRGQLEISIAEAWLADADYAGLLAFSPAPADGEQATTILNVPAISNTLRATLTRLVPGRTGEFDTLIFYHPGTEVRPSSWVFGAVPVPGSARKTMGLLAVPLPALPEAAALPPSFEGVLVHEYFHLVENRYGIKPKHGFAPSRGYTDNLRKNFPGWKGQEQYDYYDWHFRSTVDPRGYVLINHE